jgi:signal transduction histidine kinase
MIEGARPLTAAKGIALIPDGTGEACALLGDSHLLTRAIENLLDNAARHTPPGGRIWVRWQRAGPTLHFAVADSGPGIAAPDLPHLFTPLYGARRRATGRPGARDWG